MPDRGGDPGESSRIHGAPLRHLGDNVYAQRKLLGLAIGGQGDEDDDWFFTYDQPYRYVINRVPIFPSVGNHDSGETEFVNDDREQVSTRQESTTS